MEEYKLNSALDANKVFLIKRSEFENRFDTEFYKNEYKKLYSKLKSLEHYRLKDIISFSSETWNQKDYFEDYFPYIEISEINLSDGSINNINNIKIDEAPSRAKMIVRKGDIIISSTRPTRGAISYLNNINDIKIASTGFAIIRNITDEISKEFLFIILRQEFILKQFGQRSSGGNYPAITQEELGKVIIPKLNKEIQQQIVDIYNQAYAQKQVKEAEAKALLAGIDTYLLNELGISLPEKDNSLEARIFTTNFSEVTGGRLDSYYYQKEFIDFFELLEKTQYKTYSLKDISIKITSGITPTSKGDDYVIPEEGIPFIRSGNIDINGDLNFDELLYLSKDIHNTQMKSSQVKKNDLMIAIVGATIGQVGIYLDDREANINQAIALVRLKINLNCEFIKETIKSSIGQWNLNRLKRPVARANINLEEISKLRLPIPPLEKQNEIAEHIAGIRARAKALQAEAVAVLEQAKKQVEQMILG